MQASWATGGMHEIEKWLNVLFSAEHALGRVKSALEEYRAEAERVAMAQTDARGLKNLIETPPPIPRCWREPSPAGVVPLDERGIANSSPGF